MSFDVASEDLLDSSCQSPQEILLASTSSNAQGQLKHAVKAMEQTIEPLTTFPQFSDPRMPPEVQNMIWKSAIADIPSRTVELRGRHRNPPGQRSKNGQAWSYDKTYTSGAEIPAVLHVCTRSRELGMGRWKLGLKKPPGDNSKWKVKSKAWFDRERDILRFRRQEPGMLDFKRFLEGAHISERGTFRNIMVDLKICCNAAVGPVAISFNAWAGAIVKRILELFPGLRRLLFPITERDEPWWKSAQHSILKAIRATIEEEGLSLVVELVEL